MRQRRLLLIAAVLFWSVAARHRAVPPAGRAQVPADVFSASRPNEIESIHLSLDLTVDFDAQILRGSVTHTIVNHSGTSQFIVDTNGLDIDGVTIDGRTATWHFGTAAANGTPLIIDVDPLARSVRIDYRTRPSANGLRWFTAIQTRDHVAPAMWSENEPDFARSWIPLQDTPAVRTTYDATVRVPAGLLALMSAANNPNAANESGVYTFTMPHSVPAYLIAIAVGRLEFRDMGNRTGVYAEPSLLDDTAYEMQFLPDMLSAAESIIAPYPFERYDLVFPPKFGGGMENPELNFIGQDVITGNRPAIIPPHGIIAHELAHAWFGDYLTCAEWNDLWLNESFATYYEKRIEEAMGAGEMAEYGLLTDRQALDDYLKPKPADRLTVLHRTFVGSERPQFTIIWYQKGEMFLKTLEVLMGREAFDAMIRDYVARHPFHWVDDVAFRNAIVASGADLNALQVDSWIYGSGLPSNVVPAPVSALANRVKTQADAFRGGRTASSLDTAGWSNVEFSAFLTFIDDLIVPRMNELDSAFEFSEMNTPPVRWLIAMTTRLSASDRVVLDRYLSLGTPGSTVIWNRLGMTSAGLAYAVPLYQRVRDFYDAATRQQIANSLHISAAIAA